MSILLLDLARQHAPIRAALHDAARRVIDRGHYIGGSTVRPGCPVKRSKLGVR